MPASPAFRLAFLALVLLASLHALQAQPPRTTPTAQQQQKTREPSFHLAQGFKYVRQLSRRDNVYQGGTFTRTDSRILLQDVTLYKFTTFLSYKALSVFYDQGLYRPSLLEYEPFSDAYTTLDDADLYRWQLGSSVQLGSLRFGIGYKNGKKEAGLSNAQFWQPFHDQSLVYYGALQHPLWGGPVHVEAKLDLNPEPDDWGASYVTQSYGFIFYFNYYTSLKIRYYRVARSDESLSRHGLEYFFSYHLLYNVAFVVGINKILYSEDESPMQAFTGGIHYHIAAF